MTSSRVLVLSGLVVGLVLVAWFVSVPSRTSASLIMGRPESSGAAGLVADGARIQAKNPEVGHRAPVSIAIRATDARTGVPVRVNAEWRPIVGGAVELTPTDVLCSNLQDATEAERSHSGSDIRVQVASELDQSARALILSAPGFALRAIRGSDLGRHSSSEGVVEVAMEYGCEAEIRVRDANGSPVEGASIKMRFDTTQLDGTRLALNAYLDVVDGDAAFGVAGFRPGDVVSTIEAPGFVNKTVLTTAELDSGSVWEYVLASAAEVRGLVSDRFGSAVVGAQVRALPSFKGVPRWADLVLGVTRAEVDEAGEFSIGGIQRGQTYRILAVEDGRWALSDEVSPPTWAEIVLPEFVKVEGRLVSPGGEDVSAIRCELLPIECASIFDSEVYSRSNGDGEFELEVSPGEYLLKFVSRRGAVLGSRAVVVPETGLSLGEIEVQAAGEIRVCAVDKRDSSPLHEFRVRLGDVRTLQDTPEAEVAYYSENENANGTKQIASIPQLSPGVYRGRVLAEGFVTEWFQCEVRSGQVCDVVVEMTEVASLAIRVVDLERSPIRNQKFQLVPVGERRGIYSPKVPTDGGSIEYPYLEPGIHELQIMMEKRWAEVARIQVKPGRSEEEVSVNLLNDLSIQVLSFGEPVPNARITLLKEARQDAQNGATWVRVQDGLETDESGSCRLSALVAGQYQLRVDPVGSTPVRHECEFHNSGAVETVVLPETSISGQVVPFDAHPKVTLVQLEGLSEKRKDLWPVFARGIMLDRELPSGSVRLLGIGRGWISKLEQSTERQGRFEFTRISPGTYFLIAQDEAGRVSDVQSVDVGMRGASGVSLEVSSIAVLAVGIKGLPRAMENRGLKSVHIEVWDGERLVDKRAAERGINKIDSLRAGQYEVRIRGWDGESETYDVDLANADVLLEPGVTVEQEFVLN